MMVDQTKVVSVEMEQGRQTLEILRKQNCQDINGETKEVFKVSS